MATRIRVPELPQSIDEAIVDGWLKKVGDYVVKDENLVDLETEKVVLEIPSPVNGVLIKVQADQDDIVVEGQILAFIEEEKVDVTEKNPLPKKAVYSDHSYGESEVRESASNSSVFIKEEGVLGKLSRSDLLTISQGIAYVGFQIDALKTLHGPEKQQAIRVLEAEGAPTNFDDLVAAASNVITQNKIGWFRKNQFLGMIFGNLKAFGMSPKFAHSLKNQIDEFSRRSKRYQK